MKKLFFVLYACLCVGLWSCSNDDEPTVPAKQEVAVSFEDKLTEPNTSFAPTEGEDYGDWGYKLTSFTDSKSLVECNSYFSNWGFGGGFTYTNTTDVTTPGYSNLSAITGKGKDGSVYLTVALSNPTKLTNLQAATYQFKGAYITNTTYAYLAVKDGNDGSGYVKGPFEDGDYFTVTAIGHAVSGEEVGRSTFYLADYRDGKSSVVNTWEWFDWTPLANAAYVTFEMESTDTGDYGMNTPNYFCLDGITLVENKVFFLNHNEEGNIISVLRLILRKDVFVFNTQATYNTQRKDKSE